MSNWVGYAVSVRCGEPLGCYQGTILQADGNTITLTKAFRNGFPYPKSQVTINAADIKDLKIIEESKPERAEKTHSTVAVTKSNKKTQRATVCENLQANNTNTGNQQNVNPGSAVKTAASRSNAQAPVRSKPIDIQGTRNKNNTHPVAGSFGNAGSTPKARPCGERERARRRNEACFGHEAEPALDDDFDFEGNLALFDKQALWEEMRARPDVVRGADEARLALRPDEPVLPCAGPPAAIRLPEELRAPVGYTTDDGRRVPAFTEAARRRFWEGLVRYGVCESALVLLARGAADVALRLAGGGRRLEARNAHQAPVAVALAAPHRAGAAAVLAARLLASHGVRAHVLVAGPPRAAAACAPLQRELAAFALGGAPAVSRAAHLPPAPDLVLLALHDPLAPDGGEAEEEGAAEALEWARGARGALVALEPRAGGWARLWARAALVCGLPAALAPALGQQFLCDVAPPPALFHDLRVLYRPPFGAASVLPLH